MGSTGLPQTLSLSSDLVSFRNMDGHPFCQKEKYPHHIRNFGLAGSTHAFTNIHCDGMGNATCIAPQSKDGIKLWAIATFLDSHFPYRHDFTFLDLKDYPDKYRLEVIALLPGYRL